ncbi:MAG: hypothetical protein DDT26_00310 [Dehalococcoidia bacterium]|nr:hypothetical protein [Chloroflexota bacterium]
MAIGTDIQYANLLGQRLERFKVVNQSPYTANCRCPFCGDSKTDARKTRGFLYTRDGAVQFFCHNCKESCSLGTALKKLNYPLFEEYRLELLKQTGALSARKKRAVVVVVESTAAFTPTIEKFARRRHQNDSRFDALIKVSSLPLGHMCKKYVESRRIPADKHYLLYYIEKFKAFTNTLIPSKFDDRSLLADGPRLVIPFFKPDGTIFAYQGRALSPSAKVRYITIVIDETYPRIYGLERIDPASPVFVFEGPIDSLFIPNAVAQAGGDNADIWDIAPRKNLVFVFDNEPRNPDTVARMEKAAAKGGSVVVWPSKVKSKDVNQMILAETLTAQQILSIINCNTYAGLAATAAIQHWSKL